MRRGEWRSRRTRGRQQQSSISSTVVTAAIAIQRKLHSTLTTSFENRWRKRRNPFLVEECPRLQITSCFLPLFPVTCGLVDTMVDLNMREHQNDAFLQLQDVLSSLETCVLSWRTPSRDKSRDESETTPQNVPLATDVLPSGVIQELSQIAPTISLNEDPRTLNSEIQHYKEDNAVLRGKLRLTDRELDRSRATLKLFTEEKEMLQIKFKRLQDIFQDDELFPQISPPTSPCSEEMYNVTSESESPIPLQPCQGPVRVLHNVIQYVQSLPGSQSSLTSTSDIHSSSLETEMRRLKRYLDHVKELNDQLSATLEECKTDSEKLSMHLGKLESTCTALRLALQASERCLKTYSVLLALAEAKGEILLSQVTSDLLNSGWSLLPKDLEIKTKLFMMEVRKSFRKESLNIEPEKRSTEDQAIDRLYAPWLSEEDEQMLKDYIQSLKWDLSSVTVLEHTSIDTAHRREVAHCAHIIKAKVDDAIKVSVEASPCLPEKPARAQIVQELMETKKGLSELKACLQILQTEKRALELQCLTQEHENAYMLIRDHLQLEQSEWMNKEKDSAQYMKDEQKKHMGCERVSQSQSKNLPSSPVMQQLLESLKQNGETKERVESMMSELDKIAGEVHGQNIQSAQTIKDFFKAHRNLFLTYKNACRKYQEQQHKLESQVALISQHQCQQIQKLMETIQSLQRKKAERDTGETSL
ncbi:PREDICTED: colorectal mutant cancer protein-like [Nanorana parkeri]|uniref:colorectal mutant cancer protein-like n=1 Tax=Nanorana parkeri TaxID=125878 RepID=UPI00085435A9|nr:PREDICTED: colorectal mutant cancer protein-like [Nanorana parkeri]